MHTHMPVQAMAQSAQKPFASEESKHHVLVCGHGWNVCVDSGVYCVQQVYMTVCRARTGVGDGAIAAGTAGGLPLGGHAKVCGTPWW